MTQDKKIVLHRNYQMHLISDKENGEILDTEVIIYPDAETGKYFTIAGNERDKFALEFAQLVNRYKI